MTTDLIDRAALRAEIENDIRTSTEDGDRAVDMVLARIDAAPRAATEPPQVEVRDLYFYEAGLAEGRAEPLTRERLAAALDEHIYLTDAAEPDGLYRGFGYDLDAILAAVSR